MTNEELFSKCVSCKTKMQIDNIDYHPLGHVYLMCPHCGWEMSIRRSEAPDIDDVLQPTEKYLNKLLGCG